MKAMLVFAAILAVRSLAAQQVPVDPRASLFVRSGCTDCHGIVALRVKAKTEAGPDLTFAYGDVPYRYGMTLERFFAQPPGIMRLVLGVHIQLRQVQRDSLVQLFRDLYAEHVARLDSIQRAPRPVGTGPRMRNQ
jgi:hypothetical protein